MVMAGIMGWGLAKTRKLVQIFPSSLMMMWEDWEIRVVILFSLMIQILLMVMGSRRKYTTETWVRVIVWAAYLSADTAATYALGILSESKGDRRNDNYVLTSFWAPFFLLHLGGPDTITAYSLEDNELWVRQFLGVFVQFVMALYVFLKFWRDTLIDYAGIPIFVAGLTKCVERTLALRFASESYFSESMIRGPDILKALSRNVGFRELLEFVDKKEAEIKALTAKRRMLHDTSDHEELPNMISHRNESVGFHTSREFFDEKEAQIKAPIRGKRTMSNDDTNDHEELPNTISLSNEGGGSTTEKRDTDDSDCQILQYAYERFMIFMRLFADLVVYKDEIKSTQEYLRVHSFKQAFELINIELGFAYDLRYTKAKLTYSRVGCLLRFLSLSSSIVTFVVFLRIDKHPYLEVDLTITWLLLVGAIFMEFYALAILVSSDWFMLWLAKPSSKRVLRILKGKLKTPISIAVPFFQLLRVVPANKRWSGTMGQYNLTSFCCSKMPIKGIQTLKFFGIYEMLEKERSKHLVKVPEKLTEWIFDHLRAKTDHGTGAKPFGDLKLNDVLKASGWFSIFVEHEIGRVLENMELDESILVWHIATDLCRTTEPVDDADEILRLRGSCWLSEYMLYLLVIKPWMLPKGIGQLRFRHTCTDFKTRNAKMKLSPSEALTRLYHKDLGPGRVGGERSWSVLSQAQVLAKCLQAMETEMEQGAGGKWSLISEIWMEMLCYAAAQCGSNEHLQQLRRGGELLTHVWFLMAHMGFIGYAGQ